MRLVAHHIQQILHLKSENEELFHEICLDIMMKCLKVELRQVISFSIFVFIYVYNYSYDLKILIRIEWFIKDEHLLEIEPMKNPWLLTR
jgi:hypothetical protein